MIGGWGVLYTPDERGAGGLFVPGPGGEERKRRNNAGNWKNTMYMYDALLLFNHQFFWFYILGNGLGKVYETVVQK